MLNALELLATTKRCAVVPNTATHGSAIGACRNGLQCRNTCGLLETTGRRAVLLNVAAYNSETSLAE